MADRIQLRRDTAANWTAANPVLADGEIGLERGNEYWKVGDGVTAWNSLPYVGVGPKGDTGDTGASGSTGPAGADGYSAYEVAVANGFVGTEQDWLDSLGAVGVPAGGDAGQFLRKASGANHDTEWSDELDGVTIKRFAETIAAATTTIDRAGGGIQTLTLDADSSLTWTLNNGEKIQLYLTPGGFNITDWGVTHWMTDVPTLATENMIVVEKVGGNIYAWDGGSR